MTFTDDIPVILPLSLSSAFTTFFLLENPPFLHFSHKIICTLLFPFITLSLSVFTPSLSFKSPLSIYLIRPNYLAIPLLCYSPDFFRDNRSVLLSWILQLLQDISPIWRFGSQSLSWERTCDIIFVVQDYLIQYDLF